MSSETVIQAASFPQFARSYIVKVLTEVRISSFYKNTLPVVEIFREKGVLVTVDAEKSIEEVYQKSEEVVKIMLSN